MEEIWIVYLIITFGLIGYLICGWFFLCSAWWAFGPTPKPFWKRLKHQVTLWSLIVFWSGWLIWVLSK